MTAIDPKHVTIRTAGNVYYSNLAREVAILPPTPEQLAARDRAAWNAAVDRRKAEKQERKSATPSSANQGAGK